MDDQPPNRSCYGHARKRLQGYERELLHFHGVFLEGVYLDRTEAGSDAAVATGYDP